MKSKNVVGKDISIENNNRLSDFEIYNNLSKNFFLLNGKKIFKKLKIKKFNNIRSLEIKKTVKLINSKTNSKIKIKVKKIR